MNAILLEIFSTKHTGPFFCISYLFYYSDKSNLGKEVFILAHILSTVHLGKEVIAPGA